MRIKFLSLSLSLSKVVFLVAFWSFFFALPNFFFCENERENLLLFRTKRRIEKMIPAATRTCLCTMSIRTTAPALASSTHQEASSSLFLLEKKNGNWNCRRRGLVLPPKRGDTKAKMTTTSTMTRASNGSNDDASTSSYSTEGGERPRRNDFTNPNHWRYQSYINSLENPDSLQNAEYRQRTGRNHVYRGIVSYDGTNYFGFQKQGEDKITIQSELERCLMQITSLDRELLCLGAAGRTDAGVHARKQVFHFYTKDPLKDELNCMRACNRLLNKDVRVVEIAKPHPMFHSRFHAIEKTYRYTIDFGLPHSPFHRTTAFSVGYREYDMKLLEEACKVFVGTHDFAAFMNRSRDGKNLERNSERTIYSFDVVRGGGGGSSTTNGERYEDPSSMLVHLYVTGNGFLYKQVRNMVGAILSVAGGRYTVDDLKMFLEKKDRKLVPMAAPAKGLCLYDVKYPDEMYFSSSSSSSGD